MFFKSSSASNPTPKCQPSGCNTFVSTFEYIFFVVAFQNSCWVYTSVRPVTMVSPSLRFFLTMTTLPFASQSFCFS